MALLAVESLRYGFRCYKWGNQSNIATTEQEAYTTILSVVSSEID